MTAICVLEKINRAIIEFRVLCGTFTWRSPSDFSAQMLGFLGYWPKFANQVRQEIVLRSDESITRCGMSAGGDPKDCEKKSRNAHVAFMRMEDCICDPLDAHMPPTLPMPFLLREILQLH